MRGVVCAIALLLLVGCGYFDDPDDMANPVIDSTPVILPAAPVKGVFSWHVRLCQLLGKIKYPLRDHWLTAPLIRFAFPTNEATLCGTYCLHQSFLATNINLSRYLLYHP